MDQQIQLLLRRLDDLSGEFRELRDGVQMVVQIAELDPEMALTRARKVLEYIIRDVYKRRCGREPKTQPLENLLQQLVKDGHLPNRIDAYANTIRKLGNVGTHTFGEKVTMLDVQSSLNQLLPILLWYFEVERPEAMRKAPDTDEEAQREQEEAERLRAEEAQRQRQETEAVAARKVQADAARKAQEEATRKAQAEVARKIKEAADKADKLKKDQQNVLLKQKDKEPGPGTNAGKLFVWVLVVLQIGSIILSAVANSGIPILLGLAIWPVFFLYNYLTTKTASVEKADAPESKKK